MINLSNVVSLPVRQDFNVKKQEEKNNLANCSKNNASLSLVSPNVEHLKANYLSFGVNLKPKTETPVELPPFVSNMLSEEELSSQIRFKPYEKTADFIAQNCLKGKNTMLVHEEGAMPDLAANNFAGMLVKGKFKNLGMTKENTEVYFVDTAMAVENINQNLQTRLVNRVEQEGKTNIKELYEEEKQKPDPDIEKMQMFWHKKAEIEKKNVVVFISDPTIMTFQPSSPNIKTVSFAPLQMDQPSENPLAALMGGEDSGGGSKNGLPKEVEKILSMDPSMSLLELPAAGAPETKSFLKANKDELIHQELPEGVLMTDKAIDKAVDKTKEFKGANPGKTINFIVETTPAALMKKHLKKDSQYSVITPNNLEKGISAYPEVVEGEKVTEGKSFNLILDTKTKLKDVGGIDQIEDFIRETITSKISSRKTKNSKDVPPSNVLIAGEAGSGKTLLAKAIAGEVASPLVHVSALKLFDSLYSTHMKGSTDLSEIKEVFDYAKSVAKDSDNKTAFLYLDDLDVMNNKYNKLQDPMLEEKNSKDIYLEEILKQVKAIDNKNSDVNVVVLASSQNPELMQGEFNKTGLFNTQIQAPDNASSMKARISTINLFTKDMKFEEGNKEKIIKEAARVTNGASGAEIKTIIDKAGSIVDKRKENKFLTINDVLESLLEIQSGAVIQLENTDWQNELVIKHELGHAVVMQTLINMSKDEWQKPNGISFITFDPRKNFGGQVQVDTNQGGSFTFDSLINEIAGDFGGLSVEKTLYKGRNTFGPAADLENLNQRAEIGVKNLSQGHYTRAIQNPDLMKKENKKDITCIINTGEKISEMIIDFNKGFINEYGDECFNRLGKGGNTMSAEVFQKKLNTWLDKDDRREKLKVLETKIEILTDTARTKGEFLDKTDNQLNLMAIAKLQKDKKANQ